MKNTKTKKLVGLLGCLLAVSLIFSLETPVFAVPQIPHQFWGQVTIDGVSAGPGIVVSAQIDSVEYASTTTDAQGRYGYEPLFRVLADDPETPEKEGGTDGETIEFYVEGVLATTYAFQIAGRDDLSLAVGAVSVPLTADAGGPYFAVEGEEIVLSGSASDGTAPYTYAWDFDNDGVYGDNGIIVASPSVTWHVADTYTIGLEVTDSVLDIETATATVTVTEEGAFDPWEEYDTDGVVGFSYDETLAAVNDYLAGTIGMIDALAVVILYFG